MGTNETPSQALIKTQIRDAIALFGLVGTGIGLMGIVAVNQFGGGLFSGILYAVILMLAMFFGPVMAVVVTLRIADYLPQKDTTSYLTSFVGTVAGYLTMMLIVAVMLMIGVSLTLDGGSSTGVSGTSTGSSSAFDFGTLLPILALSIPTGLTGVGTMFFHRPLPAAQSGQVDYNPAEAVAPNQIPTRWLAAGGIIVVVVLGAVAGVGLLNGGAFSQGDPSNIEVTSAMVGPNPDRDATIAEITLENTGKEVVTTTLTAKQIIDGGSEYSVDEEITLDSGETRTYTLTIVSFSDYSDDERQKLSEGHWSYEVLVDGDVRSGR